ncbi:MAG TPA: hypothetical protein ENG80_05115 [Nitrospirae bacterium]|nr:N-acetylmuramoyl-L-alanine amidase AmiC precursor [bacterium BMS3Abin10]HDH01170.1 hypothetical protein [Nitrospirota bacterium]
MMKKIVFLVFVLLFPMVPAEALNHTAQGEETYSLKLRASQHHEFLRIVLEGDDAILSRGIVNQKGRDIMVRFPDSRFTVQGVKVPVTYKLNKDTVLFSPGPFSGLKVFSLKYPSRLVMDVFTKKVKKRRKPPPVIVPPEPGEKLTESLLVQPGLLETTHKIHQFKVVVIDPGHGGFESGITVEKHREKNLVLDIAKRLRALTNRDVARGFLTRKSDQFMALSDRINFTNSSNAEIFLSLHVGNHKGIVIYTPVITETVPDDVKPFLRNRGQEDFMIRSVILRDSIVRAITEDIGEDMVSTRTLPYSMLSKIEAAAVIIELPSFEDTSYTTKFKTELTNSIYKGLYLYEEEAAN